MKYRIVTIEREYASGGSAVAELLSKKLDMPVYGRELLEYLSHQLNLPAQDLEVYEEAPTSSLLYSLHLVGQVFRGEMPEGSRQDQLKQEEQELIRKIAVNRRCILVGRAAGFALRARSDVLSVFITAAEEFRLSRAVSEYGIKADDAKAALTKFDRRRAGFYHEMTGGSWQEKSGYAMVLDSSKLGIEVCAQAIHAVMTNQRAEPH